MAPKASGLGGGAHQKALEPAHVTVQGLMEKTSGHSGG